jgi:hypothetical protein
MELSGGKTAASDGLVGGAAQAAVLGGAVNAGLSEEYVLCVLLQRTLMPYGAREGFTAHVGRFRRQSC